MIDIHIYLCFSCIWQNCFCLTILDICDVNILSLINFLWTHIMTWSSWNILILLSECLDHSAPTCKSHPLFSGAKPTFMGDFNELVNKHYPKASFFTRQLLAGLLRLEQDCNLTALSNLLQNLQPIKRSTWSSEGNKALNNLNIISSDILLEDSHDHHEPTKLSVT